MRNLILAYGLLLIANNAYAAAAKDEKAQKENDAQIEIFQRHDNKKIRIGFTNDAIVVQRFDHQPSKFKKEEILDKSYGFDGVVNISYDGLGVLPFKIKKAEVTPIGKLSINFLAKDANNQTKLVIVRLNNDGTLDTSFGNSQMPGISILDT